jgi:hypothetical protein
MATLTFSTSATVTEPVRLPDRDGEAALIVAADGIVLDFSGGSLSSGVDDPGRRRGIESW